MNAQEIIAAAAKLIGEQREPFAMATVSPDGKPHVFYMGAAVRDEPFTLYLETYADSAKVEHIRHNPNVEIVLARPDYSDVLTITGTAAMEDDPQVRQDVWKKIMLSGMYFESPESKDFAVIRVTVRTVALQRAKDSPRQVHTAAVR